MNSAYAKAIAKKLMAKERRRKREEKGTLLGLCGSDKKNKAVSMSKLGGLLWEQMRYVVYAESRSQCRTCGSYAPPVACHIVPASCGAMTKFFLPNIYRGCRSCNDAERRRRGHWVKMHESIFGADFVDALYSMSQETFQIKRWWLKEQIERMIKLRLVAAL